MHGRVRYFSFKQFVQQLINETDCVCRATFQRLSFRVSRLAVTKFPVFICGERLDVYEIANDYIELWDDRWRKMEACQYVTAPLRVHIPVELIADCQVGV